MRPDHLLEQTLTRDQYQRIAAAATSKWGGGPFIHPSREVDDVVWRRHDNTVRFVVPLISQFVDLHKSKIIDFGCGCGSSSLALSHFAGEVVGLEIDPPSVEAFRVRMETLASNPVSVIEAHPEDILDQCLDQIDERSSVVLLAVVEHLTPDEQLLYLSSIWDALAPGQLLVIAETPNFLALQDKHTFDIPFAHMTQGQQFEPWLRASSPDLRFRDYLLSVADSQGTDALLTERFRLGVGVAPQVFQLAISDDLNEVVVADGFSDPIIEWFPLTPDDQHLVREFRDLRLDIPIGFARSVLSFVFRKPASHTEAEATRRWNDARKVSLPTVLAEYRSSGSELSESPDASHRFLFETQRELEAIYSSKSWRFTRPARLLAAYLRNFTR